MFKKIKINTTCEIIRVINKIIYRSKDGINDLKCVCKINNCNIGHEILCHKYAFNNGFCEEHSNGILNDPTFITTQETAEDIENFVFNILKESDKLINIKNVGYENGKLDIVFQVKEEFDSGIYHFRGIQIKTLIKNYKSYYCDDLKKYNFNTLIVGVDKEKKYMCLILKDILGNINNFFLKKSTIDNLNSLNDEIRPFLFNGLDDISMGYSFKDALINYSKNSTIYDESQFSESCLKEKEMMVRLENLCKKNNIPFRHNITSHSPADIFINDFPLQCKFSSKLDCNMYTFSIQHCKNGVAFLPYDINDNIKFFIFENIPYNFYIIPIEVMIFFGYIKTDNKKGKTRILISHSENNNIHWTKFFYNRFDLLYTKENFNISSIINIDDLSYKFQYYCFKNNIDCEINTDNLSCNLCNINGKNIRLSEANYKNYNTYGFKLRNNCARNIDFFVFRIKDYIDDFYIIPKNDMIELKLIDIYGNILKSQIILPAPVPNDMKDAKKWCLKFLNSFYLLKINQHQMGGEL